MKPNHTALPIWLRLLSIFITALVCFTPAAAGWVSVQAPDTGVWLPQATRPVAYLPLVQWQKSDPILVGIYPPSWWTPNITDTIKNLIQPLDSWQGKKSSLAGVFHSLDQPKTVTNMLPYLWDSGYVPFVNLYLNATSYDIASGKFDSTISAWANSYKTYANGGKRMAFLAPLQEMNGYWVPFGRDPANFKLAFRRIQNLFNQAGVPHQSVRWVFAPNGYSDPNDPPFESYYPGDSYVDVVAFSSYNFGYNPSNPYPEWISPQDVFQPYLDRMSVMAPSKPVFIAQTGTSGYGVSAATKNQWLKDAYTLLANNSQVRGVLYYDANVDYDWAFYLPPGISFTGYRDGIASDSYVYVPPAEIFAFIPDTSTP